MTDTITRSEYNAKKRHQHAGSRSEFEPATITAWKTADPQWKGMHWHMYLGAGGTTLAPCNVVPDPKPAA